VDGLERERGLRDVEARLLLAQDVLAHQQRLRAALWSAPRRCARCAARSAPAS